MDTATSGDDIVRSPHHQLGYAVAFLRRLVRQHGTVDEIELAHVVEWLDELEQLGLAQ